MQVTDNEQDSSFWIIMEVKQGAPPEPELQPTLVDDGYWDKWYPNALVTNPNSLSPMLFGEDSDGNWFLRPISADGKVQREEPYTDQFGTYYGSVQTFMVGGEVFLFVQNSDTKEWKIWRITKNEPIGIMDESVWNYYYSTVASYSINGRTFLFLQSGTYWNIREVLAGGTMGSRIGTDGNWENHYEFVFPIYVDPAYLNPSSWMTHMYDLLKDRTLQEIAIPGSHDAGMSELGFCSKYANACDTQTQTSGIYQQLVNGARYFDIRPTSYVDCSGSFRGWYTGHWAYVNGLDWLGCTGQSLDSVLDDVAKFCAEMEPTGGKELIILNFSHCYDIVTGDDCDDWTGSDCSDHEWVDDVRNTAVEKLSAFLIDWSKYEDPREAIFGDRAAIQHVLLRFETEAISSDPQNGVYNSDDFPIYNEYSNTNDFSTMKDNQKQKMINPVIHNAELFLLSWTLTLSGDQAYDCTGFGNPTSILDLAGEADSQLMNYIHDWSSPSPVITQTLLPNIIYVDNFGTFATRAAIYVNEHYSTLPP